MKLGKTGKINFEAVIAASVAGMGYTVLTNALSNSSTIGPKWNANKDLNYALGATALGGALMYFLPKQKWSNAAGLGLIGAGGAVAAQVITNKIKPAGTMNGFLSDVIKSTLSSTAAGKGARKEALKKLLNRNAACSCPTEEIAKPGVINGYSRRLNGVGPGSFAELAAFEALGYN